MVSEDFARTLHRLTSPAVDLRTGRQLAILCYAAIRSNIFLLGREKTEDDRDLDQHPDLHVEPRHHHHCIAITESIEELRRA